MDSLMTRCPACSTPGPGLFCMNCGASLGIAHCSACGLALAPGARFCSGCRTAAGAVPMPPGPAAPPRRNGAAWVPWAMTGVTIVLIAFIVGQRTGAGSLSGGSAQRPPAAISAVAGGGAATMPAPDISQLSPRDRVDRLYDRIMRLDAEGKRDSVQFFANMAIPGYGMLPSLDNDLRYDLGRIEEVAGALVLARAQADTILRTNPKHLLGLALGMRTAKALGDSAASRAFGERLVAASRTQPANVLPEYERHAADIAAAVKEAGVQ